MKSVAERAQTWRTSERRRWCCLTPYNGSCTEGVRWIEGNGVGWIPIEFETAIVLTLLNTVLSNLCGLPTVVLAFSDVSSEDRWRHAVTFSLSFVTSVMYHVTDVIQNGLIGLNPGQWHRLDQVRFNCLLGLQ